MGQWCVVHLGSTTTRTDCPAYVLSRTPSRAGGCSLPCSWPTQAGAVRPLTSRRQAPYEFRSTVPTHQSKPGDAGGRDAGTGTDDGLRRTVDGRCRATNADCQRRRSRRTPSASIADRPSRTRLRRAQALPLFRSVSTSADLLQRANGPGRAPLNRSSPQHSAPTPNRNDVVSATDLRNDRWRIGGPSAWPQCAAQWFGITGPASPRMLAGPNSPA